MIKKGRWQPEEIEYIKKWYGKKTQTEIARDLNRRPDSTNHKIRELGIKPRYQREYAVYFGDKLKVIGTRKHCAKVLGIDEQTMRFYLTPSHEKRGTDIFVVDLGYWEVE